MSEQTDREELPRAVLNGMSQEEYDTWLFLADKPALDEPYTYAIKQSDLTRLVRAQRKAAEIEGRLDELKNHMKQEWNGINVVLVDRRIKELQAQKGGAMTSADLGLTIITCTIAICITVAHIFATRAKGGCDRRRNKR